MAKDPDNDPGRKVRIAALRPFPRNPRRGDIAAIKESLVANGQYKPIVVNQRTMEVLVGNHTLWAASELGWEEIDVSFVDADDELAKRIVLVDNRTSDLAGYDTRGLAELLDELPSLEGSGYDLASVDELLAELGRPAPAEDAVPAVPAEARTRPGDLVELGRHRLLCGDARDASGYAKLLGGDKAQLLWTDPPYGVSYSGKTAKRLTIENDAPEGLAEFLHAAFTCVDGALAEGAPLYVAHPAGALSLAFGQAFLSQNWRLHQTLIWLKDAMVLGHADYHYKHEPILYGYKPAAARLGRGAAGWHGDNAQVSVLEIARPKASREHPTMKPPALIEIALRNSSRRGDLVLDPFAGSGSTLIACERTTRSARLIELDPGYCDVIIERFGRVTGSDARKAS